MFEPSPSALGLESFVPRFVITLVDLAHRTDEEIKAWSLGTFQQLALWLMRDARHDARLQAHLPAWRRLLGRAHEEAVRAPNGMRAFAQLMHYVWYVTGSIRFDDLRARLLEHVPQAQETVMTIAEELINKGHAQGLAQGLEQGRAQATASVLRKQLALKFGAVSNELEIRIAAATTAQLEHYLERILSAESAAAVFED